MLAEIERMKRMDKSQLQLLRREHELTPEERRALDDKERRYIRTK